NSRSFFGGTIYCSGSSSPSITNCNITRNFASRGGAIHCDDDSSPVISHSDISQNTSFNEGGGIYCTGDAGITINNCTIIENSTNSFVDPYPGGGIYCDSGDLTINNSVITANTAEFGGGIYCDSGGLTIHNSVITANTAESGGGVYHIGTGNVTITGSTITANAVTVNTSGIYAQSAMGSVTNCIIWANTSTSPTYQINGDNLDVKYSCILGYEPNHYWMPYNDPCNHNIGDDPMFVRPPDDGGDGWGVGDNDDFGDLHLEFNSPCIDAGMPNYIVGPNVLDIDGQPRIIGQEVDMGVDEYDKIIFVTKPVGGEIWTAGSSHQINWESYGVTGNGNVDIWGFDNSIIQILPIADNVPDTGTFTWNLPGSVDSNQLQVHVFPHDIDITVTIVPSGLFAIKPYSPGPPIAAKWKSLGGDFDRSGLSDNFGPEIGCIKWQFQTSAPVSASVTVADNNTVHIACEDGNLYTLDANDGSLFWTYEVDSPLLSSPTIGLDGTVYVGAQNGTLYAIDVNGDLQWTHITDGFIYSSPAVSPDGNNIYVCSQDGSLYALGRDGSELWSFQTAGPGVATGAIFASPAIGPDGTVYIAGVYDPNLYALDPETGDVIWDCNFLDPCAPDPNAEKPWPFASPVVAPDGTIYQALLYNPKRDIGGEPGDRDYQLIYDAMFYAIDPNDGNTIWSANVSDTQSYPNDFEWSEPNWFRPYYIETGGQDFYFPPHPYKQILRSQIRYYRVSRDCWSEPAIGPDGTIYVNFEDQYIRALDP
ncbi:MAG: outer membrane protein assembly factor BamB family protein, partial [Planctomycetota bacterium]